MTSSPAEVTALVLAGGGSHGSVQVGMLRALLRSGFSADLIVGTSVGAVNGAFFASDPTMSGLSRLTELWHGIRRGHIYPSPPSTWLSLLLGRRAHLCDSRGLCALLDRTFESLQFDGLEVRCAFVAADFHTGEEVILQTGLVGAAVLASAAIPVIFPSVLHDGRRLVDGALSRNTAIHAAVTLGATRVVVLPTGFACGMKELPRGVVATALHHISILFARQLTADVLAIRQARPDLSLHIVPPLCPMPWSSYDFTGVPELIRQAEHSTESWIVAGGLSSSDTPMALAPHTH